MSAIPPVLEEALRTLSTPAFVYDLDVVDEILRALREDLSVLGAVRMRFAVKANRNPALLRHLAADDVGADVASAEEMMAAENAGMRPLSLTTPALGEALMLRAADSGCEVDLDSLSQVERWGRSRLPREIGLRLRVPLDPANRGAEQGARWSRFGVNPADRLLHEALRRHDLRVVRLHIHPGEYRDEARAHNLAVLVVSVLELFPAVETVNLGGGLTYLYADRARAGTAFAAMAAVFDRSSRVPVWVFEPGMLVSGLAGYLVARVIDVGEHPDGHRLASLDASAWNLATWGRPRIAAAFPAREGDPQLHWLAGCTCYEQDYFSREVAAPPLQEGDRLLLTGFGAYAASMARSSHGYPVPTEWTIRGGRIFPGASDE
jgi:diaminopimelate decarboxylase